MDSGHELFRQLIPLLHPRTRLQDMDVLKAWYEAVEDALRPELPAELFALWVYGTDGAPILIEPEAISADALDVPHADPIVNQHLLDLLEDRIRRAGYGSVLLRPIRYGGEDVALVLLASFVPHCYGIRAGEMFDAASEVMAPMLARVTRGGAPDEPALTPTAVPVTDHPPGGDERVREQAREGELFESLSDAIGGAGTPRDLMLALSFALQPVLPHDAYELMIADSDGANFYRLALHGHGVLWGDPGLVRPAAEFNPALLFGEKATALVGDTTAPYVPRVPELVTVRGPEAPPRSLIGVRLRVLERTVGYLLIGSAGPEFYQPADLGILDRVGALVAARVDSLVLGWQYSVLKSQFDLLRHVPMHLARVAEVLAGVPFLGEGSRQFVQLAGALLPVTALEFAVRLLDERRVAVVKPGAATPLADLPQEPIEGTGVSQVVRGEVPYLLTTDDEGAGPVSVLVVPLQSGGRVFGAMAMTARGTEPFSRTDMALAQQLADLAAPHLDLARRAGGLSGPFVPGWRRSGVRPEVQGEEG